jgi:hypothetical protein
MAIFLGNEEVLCAINSPNLTESAFFGHEAELPDGFYNVTGDDITFNSKAIPYTETVKHMLVPPVNGELQLASQGIGIVVPTLWAQDANFFYGGYAGANANGNVIWYVNKATKETTINPITPNALKLKYTSGAAINANYPWTPAAGATATGYYPRLVAELPDKSAVFFVMRKVTYTNPTGTAAVVTASDADDYLLRLTSSGSTVTQTEIPLPSNSVWVVYAKNNTVPARGNNQDRILQGLHTNNNSVTFFPTGTTTTMRGNVAMRCTSTTNTNVTLVGIANGDAYIDTITNDGTYFCYCKNAAANTAISFYRILIASATTSELVVTMDATQKTFVNGTNQSGYNTCVIVGNKRLFWGFINTQSVPANANVAKYSKLFTLDVANKTLTVTDMPTPVANYTALPYLGMFGTKYVVPADNETTPTKLYFFYVSGQVVTYTIANGTMTGQMLKPTSISTSAIVRSIDGYLYTYINTNPSIIRIIKQSDLTFTDQAVPYVNVIPDFGVYENEILLFAGIDGAAIYTLNSTAAGTSYAQATFEKTATYMPSEYQFHLIRFDATTRLIKSIDVIPKTIRRSIRARFNPWLSTKFNAVFNYSSIEQPATYIDNITFDYSDKKFQNIKSTTPIISMLDGYTFNDGSIFLGASAAWMYYAKKAPTTHQFLKFGTNKKQLFQKLLNNYPEQ